MQCRSLQKRERPSQIKWTLFMINVTKQRTCLPVTNHSGMTLRPKSCTLYLTAFPHNFPRPVLSHNSRPQSAEDNHQGTVQTLQANPQTTPVPHFHPKNSTSSTRISSNATRTPKLISSATVPHKSLNFLFIKFQIIIVFCFMAVNRLTHHASFFWLQSPFPEMHQPAFTLQPEKRTLPNTG